MGDPYKKQQVKNTKKRREVAIRKAAEPRLPFGQMFANAKVMLSPVPGVDFSLDESLAILADSVGMKVVRHGFEHVGCIEGETVMQLRSYFEQDGGSNVLLIRVTDIDPLSGVARADVV